MILVSVVVVISNVMHKSCPAHHQKVTVPDPPSLGSNSSQQFLNICLSLFLGIYCLFSSIFFACVSICRKNQQQQQNSLAHHMFKRQWEGKNILLEYFWFVFSVLSVRIILDTAYCRNMAGSWARDWENHCRVSPARVSNLQHQLRSFTQLFLLVFCCSQIRFYFPFRS